MALARRSARAKRRRGPESPLRRSLLATGGVVLGAVAVAVGAAPRAGGAARARGGFGSPGAGAKSPSAGRARKVMIGLTPKSRARCASAGALSGRTATVVRRGHVRRRVRGGRRRSCAGGRLSARSQDRFGIDSRSVLGCFEICSRSFCDRFGIDYWIGSRVPARAIVRERPATGVRGRESARWQHTRARFSKGPVASGRKDSAACVSVGMVLPRMSVGACFSCTA